MKTIYKGKGGGVIHYNAVLGFILCLAQGYAAFVLGWFVAKAYNKWRGDCGNS